MGIRYLTVPLMWAALTLGCAPPSSFVVEGGTLFDAEDGRFVDNDGLVVVDGVITATDGAQSDALPRIAATNLVISPGLWDSHTHIVEQDEVGSFGVASIAWELHRGARYKLDAFIRHGVTSLRDPGGASDSLVLRDRLASGELRGPRMFSGGLMFTAPGGYPVPTIEPPLLVSRSAIEVDAPDEARAVLREYVERDAPDFIKIIYTTGPLREDEVDLEDPAIAALEEELFERYPILSREVLDALVDEASVLGLSAHCHADRFDEARDLLDAGCTNLHHAWPVPDNEEGDAFLAQMADEGVCWNVTLVSSFSRATSLYQPRLDAVRRAVDAGVRISLGTDTGSDGASTPFGESVLLELELLQDAGLSPAQALQAATIDSASCAGVEIRSTLSVGEPADLVLIDADVAAGEVLTDENILGVFVDGERLK